MKASRFIVAGSFIDGSGADVRRNVFLILQNGKISAIGPAEELPCNKGTPIDDYSYCTIVPALVDCNVSLARSPAAGRDGHSAAARVAPGNEAALVAQHIRYCRAHGVLGVAASDDIAGLLEHDQAVMARPGIVTIRTTGASCRSGKGGSEGNQAAHGDFLRVNYSGNIDGDKASSVRPTYGELCHILKHRDDRKTMVAANGELQVAEALAAGCDAIEQGYGMGKDNLRKMAEKNVLWIPSLLRAKNQLESVSGGGNVCCRFSQRYAAPGKPDPDAETYWKKMLSGQLAQLRFAKNTGVTAAVGTGAGSVGILHGESVVEEMKLFIKAGFSLEETIRCASENGARFFGMTNLGRLAVGREATFLVARGSATQLPRKLSYLTAIYVNGEPGTA
jgi:imidazolonepropionase-like amidohydrolase